MNSKDTTHLLNLAAIDTGLLKFERIQQTLDAELEQHEKNKVQLLYSMQKSEIREKQWKARIAEHECLKSIEQERLELAKGLQQRAKDSSNYLGARKIADVAHKVIRQMEQAIEALHTENQDWINKLSKSRQDLEKMESKIEDLHQQSNQNQEQKEQQDLKFSSQHQTTVAKISPVWRELYQKLLKSKLRPIVVKIWHEHCQGCFLTIPAQIYQQIQLNLIGQCPHCNRLVVYEELPKDS